MLYRYLPSVVGAIYSGSINKYTLHVEDYSIPNNSSVTSTGHLAIAAYADKVAIFVNGALQIYQITATSFDLITSFAITTELPSLGETRIFGIDFDQTGSKLFVSYVLNYYTPTTVAAYSPTLTLRRYDMTTYALDKAVNKSWTNIYAEIHSNGMFGVVSSEEDSFIGYRYYSAGYKQAILSTKNVSTNISQTYQSQDFIQLGSKCIQINSDNFVVMTYDIATNATSTLNTIALGATNSRIYGVCKVDDTHFLVQDATKITHYLFNDSTNDITAISSYNVTNPNNIDLMTIGGKKRVVFTDSTDNTPIKYLNINNDGTLSPHTSLPVVIKDRRYAFHYYYAALDLFVVIDSNINLNVSQGTTVRFYRGTDLFK